MSWTDYTHNATTLKTINAYYAVYGKDGSPWAENNIANQKAPTAAEVKTLIESVKKKSSGSIFFSEVKYMYMGQVADDIVFFKKDKFTLMACLTNQTILIGIIDEVTGVKSDLSGKLLADQNHLMSAGF